jgi:predicted glycosyltransferase involved in capsule biosynthesis
MKIDIKDFTFLIPVRFDSIIRLENALASIRYLLQNFETNILVIEAANYENGILRKLLDKRVGYIFIEDKDEIFYKTKYVNMLALNSTTPYIGIWDADVIIPKHQIYDTIVKLREGYEIGYPYDGKFYDTSEIIREFYLREMKIDILTKNENKMKLIYGDQMMGGAVFVNKKAFIIAGMENERYYGWGSEDSDRHERWKIFRYNIYRSSGCLFHLTHPRGINSKTRSIEYGRKASAEWLRTIGSSIQELKNNF